MKSISDSRVSWVLSLAFVALAGTAHVAAAAPSPQTDPCTTQSECINNVQPVPVAALGGQWILDDVHLAASQILLCGIDVKGRAAGVGTVSALVYQGSPDNQAPGALLAGPVDIVNPLIATTTYVTHFDFPDVSVPRDLWVGLKWTDPTGDGGAWVIAMRGDVTVGSSQDVIYENLPPNPPQFDDIPGFVANFYMVVYGSVPTANRDGTWGRVKATYR